MKKVIFFLMIILLIFSTGCWDMVEINHRIFPYSIGVDLNPDEGGKYIISLTYPNIYAIGGNATQEERVLAVSTVADSIFQGTRNLSTRLQYPFYFKHLRVLIIGHELSQDEKAVKELMDGINRDFIISKKIRIVTTDQMAKDILLNIARTKRQEVIEGTLYSLLQNDKRTSRYTVQSLTGFIKDMDISGTSTMPRATFNEDEIKVFGACIFKDYKFIGHLGELENRSIALLRGDVKEEIVEVPFGDADITYSISNANVEKKLDKDSKNIKIKINMEVEGVLREYIQRSSKESLNQEIIKAMETTIEGHLKHQIDSIIKILQEEYGADVLGIGEYLNKFHPKTWKEIEKDWDEIFPELEIETKITAYIRRRGLVQ